MPSELLVTGFGVFSVLTPLSERARQALRMLAVRPEQWGHDGTLWLESEHVGDYLEALAPYCQVRPKGGSGFISAVRA